MVTYCPSCHKLFGENADKAVSSSDAKKDFEITNVTCEECFLGEVKSNIRKMIELGHDPKRLLIECEKYMEHQEYDEEKKEKIMAGIRAELKREE